MFKYYRWKIKGVNISVCENFNTLTIGAICLFDQLQREALLGKHCFINYY